MADKKISTDGGAVVKKDVNAGGNFIGRDNVSTTTTSKTNNLDGNAIVTVIAVLVVGIIGAIIVVRDGSISPIPPTIDLRKPIPTITSLSAPTPTEVADLQPTIKFSATGPSTVVQFLTPAPENIISALE